MRQQDSAKLFDNSYTKGSKLLVPGGLFCYTASHKDRKSVRICQEPIPRTGEACVSKSTLDQSERKLRYGRN
jgi:hypothetical protein